MLTIYNPGKQHCDELNGCYHKNFLPYDIEKKYWKKVTSISEAEYISVHGHDCYNLDAIHKKINLIKNLNLNPNQKLLFLHIWHLDNNWTDRHHYLFARKILEQEIPNPFAFVHMNLECKSELYYDFVWNRQKVYFTDYNTLDLTDRINTADGDIKNFELMSIDKHYDIIPNLRKKFLSPNRIYKEFTHTRLEYRKKLVQFLQEYSHQGYYSDPQNGIILPANNPIVNNKLTQGGWYPIDNKIYQSSYFSLYVETLPTSGDADSKYKSITEKTWDPLIKGHFILPFGYEGLIDHIRSYGFILPDWIDYSYDVIEDPDLRFDAFLNSAEKLLDITLDEWEVLFKNNQHILEHNRQIFWDRPYDLLHDRVIKFFDNY